MITDGSYRPYTIDDVRRASARRKFFVVSTFAGCGGSSIGYALSNGAVLLANELNASAARAYERNLTGTIVDRTDIREIAATAATVRAFLGQCGLGLGELDVLDGSSPCQQFCRLGSGVSADGSATLIFDFMRLATLALPKVVVGENVPDLLGMHRDLFENAMDLLRFGESRRRRLYFVNQRILTASDFGVPQRRRRLFYVGVRADVGRAVGILDDIGVAAVFPAPTHSPVSVQSALAGVVQSEADKDPWRRAMMTNPSLLRVVEQLPHNPPQCLYPRHVGLPKDSWFSVQKAAWHRPSPCLTSLGSQPNGLSGVIHPAELRKFSVPELKALSSMPADFLFPGSIADAATQLGNLVPPLMMKALAQVLYARVLRPYEETGR